MAIRNRDEELSKEDRLRQILEGNTGGKNSRTSSSNSSNPALRRDNERTYSVNPADAKTEAIVMFKLLCSLNEGNTGRVNERPEMAKIQIEKMKDMGYDINQIYMSLTGLLK